MKKIYRVLLLLVLAVAAFLVVRGPGLPSVAHADGVIDNSSVSGAYTFEFEGSDPVFSSARGGVGVANFDGAGNVSGSYTRVGRDPAPGPTGQTTVETGTFTGTYNVNPDATVTIQFTETGILNPGNVAVTKTKNVAGGFSDDFKRFKFVDTGESSDPTGNNLPGHVNVGRGEKVSR
jgi:hypothetical protein